MVTVAIARILIVAGALYALYLLTGWRPFLWLLIAWLVIVVLAQFFT